MRAQDPRDYATPLKPGGRARGAGARSGAPAASASASRGESILLLFVIRLRRIFSITSRPPFPHGASLQPSSALALLYIAEQTRASLPSPLTHSHLVSPFFFIAHTMHTHRTHTISISCALQSASATVRTSRQRQQRWWRPLAFDICEVARRAPRQPSPHCTLPHASAESLRHYAHWCGGQAEPRTFKRISFLACRFLEKKAILIDRMRATRYSSEC